MIKKLLSGLFIIFVFVMVVCLKAEAIDTNSPHWTKSPIKVYIPSHAKSATMRHAFEKWQSKSAGNLSFIFVDNGPADIDVVFASSVDGSDGPIGQYSMTIQGNSITKAEIKIAVNSKKKYSKDLVYTTMLHEVGHVLGLPDEYRKPSCIMAMPVKETQDFMKVDLRTFYYLYGWSWYDRRVGN
ncbi:matrixin family metalloprotease [bacterium]|nr:matrixin family metalloprotease [bacterium]